MSTEWVNALRNYVMSRIKPEDLVGVRGTISSEATNPPKHLLRYGLDRIGWSARVENGKLEIFDRPIADADGRVVADYALMVRGMHVKDSEEMQFLAENRSKLEIYGHPGQLEQVFIRTNIREGFYNLYTA